MNDGSADEPLGGSDMPASAVGGDVSPEREPIHCPISVVVLSYNSETTIRRCLDSLSAQQTALPFEVIVVDSSRDHTPDIVARDYPRVRLLHLKRRAFPGEARNIGIRHSRGSVIAFLASDCVASPVWLATRFSSHQQGFSAVGGAITNANPDSLVGWANYFMEYLFCLPSRPREEIKDKVIHNLSYRRELFSRYGLFPTHLELGEDTVFNRRLMLHREPVLFEPQVRTGHINPTSLRSFVTHQYHHGLAFLRACQRGELSFFPNPTTPLPRALNLYRILIHYPLLRLRTSFRVVARQQPHLLATLLACCPFLILGVFAAAVGATTARYGPSPAAVDLLRERPS